MKNPDDELRRLERLVSQGDLEAREKLIQTRRRLSEIPIEKQFISRNGEIGRFTGGTRRCQLGSCNGICFRVKWPDGKTTWPCSKGMRIRSDGASE